MYKAAVLESSILLKRLRKFFNAYIGAEVFEKRKLF